jgi:hypothetical protein
LETLVEQGTEDDILALLDRLALLLGNSDWKIRGFASNAFFKVSSRSRKYARSFGS